jgi:hypothetical protein
MNTKRQKVAIPDKDPLEAVDVAVVLNRPVSKVYEMILEGKFGAINIARDNAKRAEYRIPLKNFIAFINAQYAEELYFHFPSADPITPVRIAKALNCTTEHIYHLILDGEFPNAINNARKNASRPVWLVPLCDLVSYVNRRREGVAE